MFIFPKTGLFANDHSDHSDYDDDDDHYYYYDDQKKCEFDFFYLFLDISSLRFLFRGVAESPFIICIYIYTSIFVKKNAEYFHKL